MTTFKFNFSGTYDSDIPDVNNGDKPDKDKEIEWFGSEEIIPNEHIKLLDNIIVHAKMFTCDDVEIGHVNCLDKTFLNEDSNINDLELAEKDHSDLVVGKYEGGLKVWECTTDLIKYLAEHEDTIKFKDANVLDLGCGVGILGIYALQQGSSVTFQDYNKEIISCVTIPSVLLNIEEENREKDIHKCKFYSGDWASFNDLHPDSKTYDVVLTSETIYNESNYKKLIDLFLKRLRKDGSVYLAAKTCYFGVGGGLRQFEEYIRKTKILRSEVIWKSTGGVQREIIKIKWL